MDQLPSNSQLTKKTEPEPVVETKKVEKVVSGKVIQRKKPLGKRFLETFFGKENSVWSYVLHEILLPAAKDTIADVVSQGVERAVYGEPRSSSRRTGSRPGGGNGYVSYNRFSSGPRREEPSRVMSQRARATHDFREIILPTRPEALAVIDAMAELASKYDQVTVSDLYDLVGVTSTFADEKWGWRDIRGIGPTRVHGGYLLDLPEPEHLAG